MKVVIKPSRAKGCVTAPASKSMAHRMLIAAALADGESVIENLTLCDDVIATAECLRRLGAGIDVNGDTATVRGFDPAKAVPCQDLYCNESGSTLRFLIPIAWLGATPVTFTGAKRLFERPLTVYERLAKEDRIEFTLTDSSATVKGPHRSTEITVDGSISSQFITGLIFSLLFAKDDARINICGSIESRSYIDLTIAAVREFGADVARISDRVISVKPARLTAKKCRIEGDYSATAFTEALSLFGGDVSISGLREDRLQGDRVYREYFKELDKGTPTLSIKDCPDLGPILFAVAAAKNGAVFKDTSRLAIKESNRADAMAKELRKFGADITVFENEVVIGKAQLHAPCEALCSHNDHRIVMSLAVLATVYGGEIEGAEAVKKSYPDFFRDLKELGISVDVTD